MYIQRGLSTQAKLISRQLVFFIVTTLLTLATITTVLLALKPSQTAKAITPPDSCFAFNSATGTITNYYDNENNNSANPACPKDVDIPSTIGGVEVKAITGPSTWTGAFQSKQLTSVTIPSSVTTIGDYAFRHNQLTTLTIPDSIEVVGEWAFAQNQLTTLILGRGLTAVDAWAFSTNRLERVTIPSNITSIAPNAFALQNLVGGDMYINEDSPHYIWSDDLTVVQSGYDSVWYAALYTEDSSNPAGLQPSIMSEGLVLWGDDRNGNGHTKDSLGGHLINPASITVNYSNSSNSDLTQPITYTGQNQDGSYITSYLARANLFLAPANPTSPTPEELSSMQAGLARYFSPGQTITLDTPTIATATSHPNLPPEPSRYPPTQKKTITT